MAMRFCSLGSGSTGNATLVEACDGLRRTRVLIDCGFSLRELAQRAARLDIALESIDAVFVTHEHGDHVGCAATLARRHRLPLWTSRGTAYAAGLAEASDAGPRALEGLDLRIARDGEAIAVGGLWLRPYTVPHDAREPLQLCAEDGERRLGVLTDAGMPTPHLLQQLQQCDALLLECNHDPLLLQASTYPASVKARIAGRLGHLANGMSAEILGAVRHARLRHVVAAHLSERNNTPGHARAALAPVLGCRPDDLVVADPRSGFGWLALQD